MIQQDKLLHFFYGSIILHLAMVLFNPYISMLIVVIVAGAKELIYDKYMNKGNCELLDFIFTVVPCVLYLISLYFR
jgi:hypothetical protein